MKTRLSILAGAFLLILGSLDLTSCKKDSISTTNQNATTAANLKSVQLQNSDAQDAVADKTDEDIDSKLDELQNNYYSADNTKSASVELSGTVDITVDHPDSTYFPKVVTITYTNYQDSCADETITKNGQIVITVDRKDVKHPRLISRAFVFHNFAVTTDSTNVIMNGTRTVKRTKDAVKLNNLESARATVTDSITAALSYAVSTIGKSETLTFTRNVDKARSAITHFRNKNFKAGDPIYNLNHLAFRHLPSLDSLKYTGTIKGINEKSESYAKIITSPLIVINYHGSLVMTSGMVTYTAGTTDSYLITFEQDPDHMHKTLVTVKDNNTTKVTTFDRRISRILKKWW